MMFISASDNKDSRLSNFAQNIVVHFAYRKKTGILAKTRNLLLQCDFAVPEGYTGESPRWKNDGVAEHYPKHLVDLLFLSERCVVSKAASQLVTLVYQILQKVCLSSTRVPLEFYCAGRDAVLLYEAVIPVKLERQLDDINQVAALIHNDGLYLSQEILGLAFEATDGADGFQNTHQMQQFESAKFCTDHSLFSRITRDILFIDDMAAEETLQLQRLIHLILENLSSLLESITAEQESAHPLDDFVPSLLKICKLAELLDMPLKSITTAWEGGELFSRGFALSEVQDLFKAIFADSPFKERMLMEDGKYSPRRQVGTLKIRKVGVVTRSLRLNSLS